MAVSLRRPAVELLSQYAEYHRDKRNIVTHFIGIPMIVFAIGMLLARVHVGLLTPAWILWALSTVWYLTRGHLLLGVAVSVVNGVLIAAAHACAGGTTAQWLSWGVGAFVVGWAFQFVGHYFEGRKPAFVDDLVGLLVGPMFVVAEWVFALGACADVAARIEQHAGPAR
jgi:uncharacterized membrane protein YGL010W